jgi:hypothetical protein
MMNRRFKQIKTLAFVLIFTLVSVGFLQTTSYADTTDSSVYGSGSFGDCDYGTCTITLTDTGVPTLTVVPTPTGACSVQSDTVSVLTDSTTGYSLTMTTSTTNSAMQGASTNLATASGTAGAPTTLAINTWGYRVDGLASFGTGPTTAQNSGNVPSVTFAGVPASNQSSTQVAYSNSPANPAQDTKVWYGVCANASIPVDTYSETVVYTAVTN